jgi:hydroxyacylglutathione hydrolase
MLRVEAVPAFEDNYIWLLRRDGGNAVVAVDPGDPEPVLEVLRQRRLSLAGLLITHRHSDHTGGIRELARQYGMPVYGPARENIGGLTHRVAEGDGVEFPQLQASFRVMDVPGHTLGHVAYFGHGCLFCGDTLFTGGCGRLFEGTPGQMHDSLSRIAALPEPALVYCAHEYTEANLRFAKIVEPDNPALLERIAATQQARRAGLPTVPALLSLEKQTNPFLRCAVAAVIAAAERFARRRLPSGADVFGALRHWKDSLD